MKYKEKLNELHKEAGNQISADALILNYRGVYRVGDCKKAASKVAERVPGYKAVKLNIGINDFMYNYVQTHYYATNGRYVIDLTAPAYIKEFIQEKIASSWHKANADKMLFDERDYLSNFKNVSKRK